MSALFDDLCQGLQEAIEFEKGNANAKAAPAKRDESLDKVYIGSASAKKEAGDSIAMPGNTTLAVPMQVTTAASACNCDKGNTCSILWKYY